MQTYATIDNPAQPEDAAPITIMTTHTVTQQQDNLKQAISHCFELLKNNRPDLAEQQAEEILNIHPDEVNALRVLGAAHRLQSNYPTAIKHLSKAVGKAPKFALAHQELGLCLFALGDVDQAIEALQAATHIEPALDISWKTLGELYLIKDDAKAAEFAFDQHMRSSAQAPELIQAVEFLKQGKVAKAEHTCREYLKQSPTDVSAIRLLADIGLKLKIFSDAENLLERCLELAPDYHLARLNYATALNGQQKPGKALEQLLILEQSEPEKPTHLFLKASVLGQMGNYEEALAVYEQIVSRYKPPAKVIMSHGHALKTVGQQAKAIAAYEQAIAMEPTLGEAYWSLANLKTFRFSDEQIASMEAMLQSQQAKRADYYHLCFAMGKALEDREAFEKSFHFYDKGNQLKKKLEGYDREENHQNTQRQISCFNQQFITERPTGCPVADPVFIVGLPRSGSTLLEQILASHSLVDGTKELPDIIALTRRLGERKKKAQVSKYPEILAKLTPHQLTELGEEYLQRASIQRGSAPYFIDKMPNNFAHIGFIHSILPNAKIIDARRHPMDACFSGFKQLFASGQRFTYGLDDIGHYYRDYVELMDHWDAVLPGKVLRVHYEEVIADPEQQIRRLLEHCGLAFEESCLNFHQTDRAVRTASSEQVRQPIYKSSVEQWRHFSPYLGELKQALGPVLERYPLD